MLYLLSPAKTLDYDTPVDAALLARATKPPFIARSAELIEVLRRHSSAQIAQLMNLSETLATLNAARYAAWSTRFTAKNSKPAVLAFDGDVYEGLQAPTLRADELAWAQRHVAILSGLYGVLRPLDLIQPYRLEMGTRLATASARDLYGYWGDTLAEHLNEQLASDESPVIVNLASQEYFRAADRKALKARVVECVFEDWKSGRYKIISFFAKRARGLMARYAIERRIATPKQLERFDVDGYTFAADVSRPERLVFRRRID
jgi:cytoplasmic iron level regulating protein YaaA (DUF328/UPF0246 family)